MAIIIQSSTCLGVESHGLIEYIGLFFFNDANNCINFKGNFVWDELKIKSKFHNI